MPTHPYVPLTAWLWAMIIFPVGMFLIARLVDSFLEKKKEADERLGNAFVVLLILMWGVFSFHAFTFQHRIDLDHTIDEFPMMKVKASLLFGLIDQDVAYVAFRKDHGWAYKLEEGSWWNNWGGTPFEGTPFRKDPYTKLR